MSITVSIAKQTLSFGIKSFSQIFWQKFFYQFQV